MKNNKYLLENISNKCNTLIDSTRILSDLTRRDMERSDKVYASQSIESNYDYDFNNSIKKYYG